MHRPPVDHALANWVQERQRRYEKRRVFELKKRAAEPGYYYLSQEHSTLYDSVCQSDELSKIVIKELLLEIAERSQGRHYMGSQ